MTTTALLIGGYLRHRPLSAGLAVGLVALGTGLLSLLALLDRQLTAQFDRNLAGVDLVIGAKGSPLQLVTSTLYHADAPTGNVPVAGVAAFARPTHPLIDAAVPLALGDSYAGIRIVGTTPDFYRWYGATPAEGKLAESTFEVTLGARAAAKTGLGPGDTFASVHGLDDNPDLAHADAERFRVTGVLAPTDLVIDELIITPLPTVWAVHGGGHGASDHDARVDDHPDDPDRTTHEEYDHDHGDHDHADDHSREGDTDQRDDPNHGQDHAHDHESSNDDDHDDHGHGHPHDDTVGATTPAPWYEQRDESITALLAKFSARNTATLNFARNLNENTDLMAASPPVVMAQFSEQVAGAEAVIRALGLVILVASLASLLVILLNALRERTGDLALLRSLGATPSFVFGLVLAEGLALAAIGTAMGLLLGRGLFYLLTLRLGDRYPVGPADFSVHPYEPYLVGLSLLAALVAALFPAWRAYRVDPGLVRG